MKVLEALNTAITQQEFALVVGVSEAKVSQLVSDGVLPRGDSAHAWLLAYCLRLREVAAGRASGEPGGLDLVQERAALAREQRVSYELRNAVTRGEYAPITLLAETLALASQSVVERFEQLPATLRKACPDLPHDAHDQIMAIIAAARNEWVTGTLQLLTQRLAQDVEDEAPTEDGS